MTIAHDSGSGSPCSSPGRGHCVVFQPMGTSQFNAGTNPASRPGGVEVFLFDSCCSNRDKLRLDRLLGLYVDLTLLCTRVIYIIIVCGELRILTLSFDIHFYFEEWRRLVIIGMVINRNRRCSDSYFMVVVLVIKSSRHLRHRPRVSSL